MKHALTIIALALAVPLLQSCANFIRESDAIVMDVVPGTERASLDDQRIEGALVIGKVRFTCQKRLYAVTNIYETPYLGSAEAYEVPMGLVAIVPALLWSGIAQLVSLGSDESSGSAGPLHWAAAGLNPFLNVENGMFEERYDIRRKPGSQRPQEGSRPEPYDAVITPRSPLQVAFLGGASVDYPLDDAVSVTLNLLEIARVMPSADVQRIDMSTTLEWNPEAPAIEKSIPAYIDDALAAKLYLLRDVSRVLFETTRAEDREAALDAFAAAGFSREAAMLRDRLPPLPTPPSAGMTPAVPESTPQEEDESQ